ncbi:MAG: hypothetical protein JW874_13560 [Spirochaetales bacterium]|nr:hypothetical protein [Spirochaetales bacterium]
MPNGDVVENVEMTNGEIENVMVNGMFGGAKSVTTIDPDGGSSGGCGSGGTQTGPEPDVVSTGGGGGCAA